MTGEHRSAPLYCSQEPLGLLKRKKKRKRGAASGGGWGLAGTVTEGVRGPG